jgi:hypothetical protein
MIKYLKLQWIMIEYGFKDPISRTCNNFVSGFFCMILLIVCSEIIIILLFCIEYIVKLYAIHIAK